MTLQLGNLLSTHNIISWKVKGLIVPEKHSSVLRELHKLKTYICFLQETHFGSQGPTAGEPRIPPLFPCLLFGHKIQGGEHSHSSRGALDAS